MDEFKHRAERECPDVFEVLEKVPTQS